VATDGSFSNFRKSIVSNYKLGDSEASFRYSSGEKKGFGACLQLIIMLVAGNVIEDWMQVKLN
jgi:hypothetical protein